MANKDAETEFARLCSTYNIWAHKWRNVYTCYKCGTPIFDKLTSQLDKRPDKQRETVVDYLTFIERDPVWVECKGKRGTTSWAFSDMDQKQRNFLDAFYKRGVPTSVFILIGSGVAPLGRGAWWIPWYEFKMNCNYLLLDRGVKSISYAYACDVFQGYRLEWDVGGWTIPKECWIAQSYPNVLHLPPLF
jgi:hypothetical protein